MRMRFELLPIGARFIVARGVYLGSHIPDSIGEKIGTRRYRHANCGGRQFAISPGVWVDCIDDELRLSVLAVRHGAAIPIGD